MNLPASKAKRNNEDEMCEYKAPVDSQDTLTSERRINAGWQKAVESPVFYPDTPPSREVLSPKV